MPILDPGSYIDIAEDFLQGTGFGQFFSSTSSGGTAAASSNVIDASHMGILQIATSTGSTTARGSVAGNIITMSGEGYFETLIQLGSLSNVSEEYSFDCGLAQGYGGSTAPTDGMYFKYDRLTSTNWICTTIASSVSTGTATTTSTAVAAGSWVKLKASWNSALSQVTYFINGSQVAQHAANIPSASTGMKLGSRILKSAGTSTNYFCYIDYWSYRSKIATPR